MYNPLACKRASISNNSTRKMIDYYESGIVVPYLKPRGHSLRGVGALLGWEMRHHEYLYTLYHDHHSTHTTYPGTWWI